MMSFLKRFFGQNSTNTFKRAKSGTYDESVFIDPKTGKFMFPKYKNQKGSLISIRDCTDYKEQFWDDLEPDEKRAFTIRDFEFSFIEADLEIEPFWRLFDKASSAQLKPYPYLKDKGEELSQLVDAVKDDITEHRNYILADTALTRQLYESGCFNRQELRDDVLVLNFKKYGLGILNVKDLKAICKKNNLNSSFPKQELISQLMEKDVIDDLPLPIVPNDKFGEMMNCFNSMYINDIKKNIQGWHPFYIKQVWELVSNEAENEEVEKIAKDILDNRFWEASLYDEPI